MPNSKNLNPRSKSGRNISLVPVPAFSVGETHTHIIINMCEQSFAQSRTDMLSIRGVQIQVA